MFYGIFRCVLILDEHKKKYWTNVSGKYRNTYSIAFTGGSWKRFLSLFWRKNNMCETSYLNIFIYFLQFIIYIFFARDNGDDVIHNRSLLAVVIIIIMSRILKKNSQFISFVYLNYRSHMYRMPFMFVSMCNIMHEIDVYNNAHYIWTRGKNVCWCSSFVLLVFTFFWYVAPLSRVFSFHFQYDKQTNKQITSSRIATTKKPFIHHKLHCRHDVYVCLRAYVSTSIFQVSSYSIHSCLGLEHILHLNEIQSFN